MHRPFLLCLISTILPAATTLAAEPQVRFVATGWNAPTAQQFLRDAEVFLRQPFDGCAMNARADTAPPNPAAGDFVPIQKWDSWTRKETSGEVEIKNNSVTISAATDSAGMAGISVNPGERYRVTARVRQNGRGLARLVVRYRDSSNQWIAKRGVDSFTYPESGDPSDWRTLTVDAIAPDGADKLIVVLSAKNQRSRDDTMEFKQTEIHRLLIGRE